jgi:Arc/MetJ family transcription regulator
MAMGKHLVDIDEDALRRARAQLGTDTIKDTVNDALRRVSGERQRAAKASLDVLARARLEDRERAWR